MQTLAVLLIGATLGSHKAVGAVLCYYAQILLGFPVLAGGLIDPLIFFGPKGGYVLGFCLQAYLMGWVVERNFFSKPLSLLVGGLLGCTVQMVMGVMVLAQFVGWNLVWTMGLFPFIPGEILKVLAVSYGLKRR